MSEDIYEGPNLAINSYWGGKERGRLHQVTLLGASEVRVGMGEGTRIDTAAWASITPDELEDLRKALNRWKKRTGGRQG